MKIAHAMAKTILWILEKGAYLQRPLYFVVRIAVYPLQKLGTWVVLPGIVMIYNWYIKIKRELRRIIPPKNPFLFFLTRRAMIHVMVILITLGALTNNLFAKEALVGEERNTEATRILFTILPPPYEEDVPAAPIDELGYGYDHLSQDDLGILDEEEPPPLEGGDYDVAYALPFIHPQTPPTRREMMIYEVAGGDTISSIAQKFDISLETILWENKLTSRSTLQIGQQLRILPITGVAHTVRTNDTISSIAKRYASTIDKIEDFNQLYTDQLVVGRTLVVPDGKIAAPRPTIATIPSLGVPKNVIARQGKGMAWPSSGRRISQYFSWRHPGLDIATGMGAPVSAALAGKVIFSGWQRGYGLAVMVDHGQGLVTRYAHNSRNLVNVGEEIVKGQVIALEGSTGNSTGPHVHFEVIVNRVRVNPLQFFK